MLKQDVEIYWIGEVCFKVYVLPFVNPRGGRLLSASVGLNYTRDPALDFLV